MGTEGDWWIPTQQALQAENDPLVDKPKLAEKLLQRPPFRFLHDVISAVQRRTGFAPGLYTGPEADAHAIQDKDAKVAYLTKIIDVVGLCLNTHVPAKPLKIVAGLEPEHTNTLLQMLARAARQGPAADVVQRVLAGEHQPPPGQVAPPQIAVPRPSSRPSSQQRPKEDRLREDEGAGTPTTTRGATSSGLTPESSTKQRDGGSRGTPGTPTTPGPAPSTPPSRTATGNQGEPRPRRTGEEVRGSPLLDGSSPRRTSKEPSSRGPNEIGQNAEVTSQRVPSGDSSRRTSTPSNQEGAPGAQASAPQVPSAREGTPPSSTGALGTKNKEEAISRLKQSSRRSSGDEAASSPPAAPAVPAQIPAQIPRSLLADEPLAPPSGGSPSKPMRPQSARKAPPKVANKDGVKVGTKPPPSAGAPGSGVASRQVALFEEGAGGDEDDDVQIVQAASVPAVRMTAVALEEGGGNQGVLVKDILEAEKELKRAGAEATAGSGEASKDQSTGIILKRQGKTTTAQPAKADLTQVRDMVQKLCQNAMPLARSMDYLQEDIENMAKEYRFWNTEKHVYQDKLAAERQRDQDTHELEGQLEEMDNQVREVKQKLIGLRVQIIRNDETIEKLLSMVAMGS